ncbi:MAG: sigma 54-interacting transcriptional regulator [bacterium]|nr:sigma 54-interacting transcriptional regulator [bacterium]
MEHRTFWDEELRAFPHGGRGAAVWVVRRDGAEPGAPLRLLLAWDSGQARRDGLAARPPLGALLRAMGDDREELIRKSRDVALWVEPLRQGGQVVGCLGIWMDAAEAWREGIFLWGQRLVPRLLPVLGVLESQGPVPGETLNQPTLFPLAPLYGPGVDDSAGGRPARPARARGGSGPVARVAGESGGHLLSLPRPVTVPGIPGCVGISAEMARLGQRLANIARSGVNVLLHGESGTGKEIVARALHVSSDRAAGPFVAQNCAALPETLFESELFGHRAGAFTGAATEKKGLLASASGGTFFLDEIGDMPLALQIKLLRVMQERQVRRIGELKSVPVDLRFVAATHKDLTAEIREGRFRLDLFYRLKVVSIAIPPLRHRPEDVAPLFAYFLKRSGRSLEKTRITEEALAALQRWQWPGNVRELENEAQRLAALFPDEPVIRHAHLSREIRGAGADCVEAADLGTLRALDQAGELLERYLIRKAIAACDGRKAAAARRLGLSRQGLYKKIARYGMLDLISTGAG